ncbi:MAG: ABC transporter substrate-binding protein [Opitutaceae bacterium]|nr:ABC transporter substrate-binding protein [Opitutaceae bacterium]
MSLPPSTAPATAPPGALRPLRVGYVALTAAAPLVAAQECGFFARHGIRVELCREIGWATMREKVVYGELDAAQAPAPMLWSMQLGLGCPPCDVLTALVLGAHGSALTLSRALWDAGVRDAVTLRAHVAAQRSRLPLAFGVTFPFSSQHLLLLEWLRAARLHLERDARIVVVPPAQLFRHLNAGTIDGFYAGEPWNSLAVRDGLGWCPTWSAAQQAGHLDNVLLVTRRFAESRADDHGRLVRALAEATAWCDEPQHREPLAEMLSGAAYLNQPATVIGPTLLGRFDCGHGRIETAPHFHVFHRDETAVPTVEKANALQAALVSAALLPSQLPRDAGLARRLFREDLHRAILAGTLVPV